MRIALSVLAEADELPVDHPDAERLRVATAKIFKSVKERRRRTRLAEVAAHDRAVIAATATGAPGRIDDETRGIPLTLRRSPGASAGDPAPRPAVLHLQAATTPRCDAFYHQLCPTAPRSTGRDGRPVPTSPGAGRCSPGGRAKIGMYIALRLLRDGAHTTITTRFPNDAARRFAAMPDSAEWLHRLRVVGIDLRDPAQVVALTDSVAAARSARHPHQQRRPDRAPLARRVRPPRRRRVGAAARRAAARAGDLRPRPRAGERRAAGPVGALGGPAPARRRRTSPRSR